MYLIHVLMFRFGVFVYKVLKNSDFWWMLIAGFRVLGVICSTASNNIDQSNDDRLHSPIQLCKAKPYLHLIFLRNYLSSI